MYTPNDDCEGLELSGSIAYQSFNKTVFLEEMMRQGPEETEFRETLLRVRKGIVNEKDIEIFGKREAGNVSESELEEFAADAVALYAEHVDCNRYNQYR